MIDLLLALTLWTPASVGLGLFLFRWLATTHPLPHQATINLGELGLLGLVGYLLLGQVAHYFFPLNPWLSLFLWALGVGALLFQWPTLRRHTRRIEGWGFALQIPVLCYISLGATPVFDTGYYHLPMAKLSQAVPMPFGIAHLCPNYAHPSSWFVLAALFRLPGLGTGSMFAINPLLCAFFLTALLSRLQTQSERKDLLPSSLFAIFLFAFANHLTIKTALTPDLPAAVFTLYAWLLALRCGETSDFGRYGGLCLIFAATAMSAKMVTAPTFLGAVVVFAYGTFTARKDILSGLCALFVRFRSSRPALFSLIFLAAWVTRGLALSGCLAYPMASTCIPGLPWGVSPELAREVSYNARTSGGMGLKAPTGFILSDLSWIPEWYRTTSQDALTQKLALLTALGLLGVLISFVMKRAHSTSRAIERFVLLLLALNTASLVAVFLVAPYVRFAFPYLLATPPLIISYALLRFGIKLSTPAWLPLSCLGIAFMLSIRTIVLTSPPAPWSDWPRIPKVDFIQNGAFGEFKIGHPKQGLQCWDEAPLCACYPNPRLRVSRQSNHWLVFSEKQSD